MTHVPKKINYYDYYYYNARKLVVRNGIRSKGQQVQYSKMFPNINYTGVTNQAWERIKLDLKSRPDVTRSPKQGYQ